MAPAGAARRPPLTSAARLGLGLLLPLLSLLLASFHPACGAEASSSNTTASTHHQDSEETAQCPSADFCGQAARCCRASVDEYGWVAAAVGWSLWFLTLILLCVDRLMKLRPEEPKDLRA